MAFKVPAQELRGVATIEIGTLNIRTPHTHTHKQTEVTAAGGVTWGAKFCIRAQV